MKNNISKFKYIWSLALISLLMLVFTSCGQNKSNQNPQQQAATGEKSEKIPDQLKNIDQSIEKIFKELNGPTILKDEAPKEGQKQNSNQKQGTESKGSENKEESTKNQGQQEKQAAVQTPPPDPWQKINTIVNELHYQWNSYTAMALKNGVNKNTMDNFGNALNNLTNTVSAKNNMTTMLAASTLYGYVPDFYYLYKTKASPEIKRIRHYTRSSMLFAMNANWAQADADINNLKSSWNMYKNTVPDNQKESVNKLDYAIYEYEKVVKEKNQQLSDIKGRVILANIESLEKAMEEAEKK